MRFPPAALLIPILWPSPGLAQTPGSTDALGSDMLAWFETLGMPDVSGKPFVRVETGLWIKPSNGPRQYQSVEGFLLNEDADSFTVYIAGVREFHPPNSASYIPTLGEANIRFAPMRTAHFEREFDLGDETGHASYTVLDLGLHAAELAERIRLRALIENGARDLCWPLGYPAPGAQIVGFAHALHQSGREPQGNVLLQQYISACLADEALSREDSLALLQDMLGRAFVEWAETDMADGIVPRNELIDVYARFGSLFPPGDVTINYFRDYMRDGADILERMAAEEVAHVARPLASLAPAAQAAELIYQLRDLHLPSSYRAAGGVPYPFEPWIPQDDSEKTPLHRLVDLGDAAVPALIEALGDDSFTRTLSASMRAHPTRAMRVNEFALAILEHMAGQGFPRETDDGRQVIKRSRPYVEKWWAERQSGND